MVMNHYRYKDPGFSHRGGAKCRKCTDNRREWTAIDQSPFSFSLVHFLKEGRVRAATRKFYGSP